MGTVFQDVIVSIKYEVDEAGGKKEVERVTQATDIFGKTSVKTYKKVGKGMKQVSETMKGVSKAATQSLAITLPLMFSFQQVSKAMKSILDPAYEMVGVQEIYNDLLAVKYLPTALEQLDSVLALGDAWALQDEGQRLIEGNMIRTTQLTGDLVSFVSQATMAFGAFGAAVPAIGRPLAEAGGAILSTAVGLAALTDENTRTITSMSGLGSAIAISGTDIVGDFATSLKTLKEDPSGKLAISGLVALFTNFGLSVPGLGTAASVGFMSNLVFSLTDTTKLDAEQKKIYNSFVDIYSLIKQIPVIGWLLPNAPEKLVYSVSSMTPMSAEFANRLGYKGGYNVPSKTDFISRPNGGIASFAPDDTIIGMKDFSQLGGGGTVINVTVQGNASRETADEIARQVDRVLNDSMKRMAR